MRELKSFSKEVLIRFIAEYRLSLNPIQDLERIERDARIDKLLRESDEILEAQRALTGKPDGFREWMHLSDKWDKRQAEMDKLLGLTDKGK